MTNIKELILNKNKEYNLDFDSKKHEYSILQNNKKQILPSVTTLISRYFPFKQKQMSRIVAEKTWTTEKEVVNHWRSLADLGTYIHDIADKFCQGEELNQEEEKLSQGVRQFFIDYPEYEIIASEIRLCSPKLKVAGTIDLLILNKKNHRLYTIDWKTSKKSITKDQIYGKGLKPFDYIQKGKFYQYSMQLWGYNLVLEKEYNIEIFDSLIVRLLPDSYEIVEPLCMREDMLELFEIERDKI